MRISDWSSDVCSSDLRLANHIADGSRKLRRGPLSGKLRAKLAELANGRGPHNGGLHVVWLLDLENSLHSPSSRTRASRSLSLIIMSLHGLGYGLRLESATSWVLGLREHIMRADERREGKEVVRRL